MAERKYKTRSVRNANWDSLPLVEGRISERGEHKTDEGPRPFIVVETDTSLVRVYLSKDLEELFKVAKLKDCVRIEFLELVSLDGGRKFRRFDSSCWTE